MKKKARPPNSKITISIPDTDDQHLFYLAVRRESNKKWNARHPDAHMLRGKHTVMDRCFSSIQRGLAESQAAGTDHITRNHLEGFIQLLGGAGPIPKSGSIDPFLAANPRLAPLFKEREAKILTQGQLVRFILHYEPTLSKSVAVKFAKLYRLLQEYQDLKMMVMFEGSPLLTGPPTKLKAHVERINRLARRLQCVLPKNYPRLAQRYWQNCLS